jgi:hypothetical protein
MNESTAREIGARIDVIVEDYVDNMCYELYELAQKNNIDRDTMSLLIGGELGDMYFNWYQSGEEE